MTPPDGRSVQTGPNLGGDSLVGFAHHLADLAGTAIMPLFRSRLDVQNKAADADLRPFDPVTAADRAAETAMRAAIRAQYPTHGIVGEEFGAEGTAASHQWVLDPIDGTRAFILGLPVWGTLIGLTDAGRPVLGMMDQPFTRERYWASARGAFFRDPDGRKRRLETRPSPRMADAMMTTTHPDLFAPGAERQGFERVKAKVRACRYGGDCYTYCLLAAGHIDLIVEAGLKPYDVTALVPIIEHAGGVITTWDGAPASRGGRIVAAGDAKLHAEAMRVLKS